MILTNVVSLMLIQFKMTCIHHPLLPQRLKKASERKEHDIDFEVKRFNLSIGQDEPEDLEKESSICIARPPTPVKKDEELK